MLAHSSERVNSDSEGVKSGDKNGGKVFMLISAKNHKRPILRTEQIGEVKTAEHDPQRRT